MMGFEKLKTIAVCLISLLTAGGLAFGMLQDDPQRFEKGLRGEVVAVAKTKTATTVTVPRTTLPPLIESTVAPPVVDPGSPPLPTP